jgi:glutamate/tyrosine decarboxylase-like PLP-dependent enzyme
MDKEDKINRPYMAATLLTAFSFTGLPALTYIPDEKIAPYCLTMLYAGLSGCAAIQEHIEERARKLRKQIPNRDFSRFNPKHLDIILDE